MIWCLFSYGSEASATCLADRIQVALNFSLLLRVFSREREKADNKGEGDAWKKLSTRQLVHWMEWETAFQEWESVITIDSWEKSACFVVSQEKREMRINDLELNLFHCFAGCFTIPFSFPWLSRHFFFSTLLLDSNFTTCTLFSNQLSKVWLIPFWFRFARM